MSWQKVKRVTPKAVLLSVVGMIAVSGVWSRLEQYSALWWSSSGVAQELGETLVWLWVGVNLGKVVLM